MKRRFVIFRRTCKRCDKWFNPRTRFNRVCSDCDTRFGKNAVMEAMKT